MGIKVHPITATLGAEVTGVGLAAVDDSTRDELHEIWMEHKVLVFRDQHITIEEHIAFGRLFGDLEVHPFTDNDEGHPEVVVLEAGGDSGKSFVAAGKYPPQRHPVIRTHPVTGARGIYTNIGFTSHVDGVSEQESSEILRHLERAIRNPSVQCRVRWGVDTFVMWDNRAVQHAAAADFLPEHRLMERVTIVGDRPF